MVTRSIVGRILILAVLVVSLGVIAQAALIITHEPAKKNVTQPGTGTEAAADQQETAPIRVVYPGPLGENSAPVRKIADAAPASPLPVVAPPATMRSLSPAAIGAVAQVSASQEDFDTGEQRPVVSSVASKPVAPPQPAQASPPAPTTSTVEVASAEPELPNTSVQPQQTSETAVKGVNINSASAEALNHLLGGGRIGQSIVQHRPYKSVDDLVKKRVLRRAVYDQIKNQIAAQ